MSNRDPSRNASSTYNRMMDQAKNNRAIRYRDEEKNKKVFGIGDNLIGSVSYDNKDNVIERTINMGRNALKDVNTDNQLINTLASLTDQIAKNTLEAKKGTKEMVKEKNKQVKLIEENIKATEKIQKTTEKNVKKQIEVVDKWKPMSAEAIKKEYALILQAEKEMFVGINN